MVRKIILTVLDASGREAVLVKNSNRKLGSGYVLPIQTAAGRRINAVVVAIKKDGGEQQVEAVHSVCEDIDDMLSLLKADGWAEAAPRLQLSL
jgi:hypothetical protein